MCSICFSLYSVLRGKKMGFSSWCKHVDSSNTDGDLTTKHMVQWYSVRIKPLKQSLNVSFNLKGCTGSNFGVFILIWTQFQLKIFKARRGCSWSPAPVNDLICFGGSLVVPWWFEIFAVGVHVLLSIFETMSIINNRADGPAYQQPPVFATPVMRIAGIQYRNAYESASRTNPQYGKNMKNHHHLDTGVSHIPAFLQDQSSSSLLKIHVFVISSPCSIVIFGDIPRIQNMVSSFSYHDLISGSLRPASGPGSCYFIYHCGPKQLALSIPDEQNREAILENLDSALTPWCWNWCWTLKNFPSRFPNLSVLWLLWYENHGEMTLMDTNRLIVDYKLRSTWFYWLWRSPEL